MPYSLGIDVGSSLTKAVVLNDGGVPVARSSLPSSGQFAEVSRRISREALEMASLSGHDIACTFVTGYGAGAVDFADNAVSDIQCHAAGVTSLLPSVRMIVDIGNQFCRAIKLDEAGRVTNFVHNEKCAGGSARFLQVIARILQIRVEDIGALSLKSQNPVEFTTGCAVFAESEAVSRIAEGASPEDILAGVHKAMVAKILNLTMRLGLPQDCVLTGGGAMDIGLVRTLEEELAREILVPEQPLFTAALGAALLAQRACRK